MPSYNLDKLLTVTKALPAAAANHNSPTIDLMCPTPYPTSASGRKRAPITTNNPAKPPANGTRGGPGSGMN